MHYVNRTHSLTHSLTHSPTHSHRCTHTQYLSWNEVLSVVGTEEWRAVGNGQYPVKLLVAGKGSACLAPNIEGMVEMVPRTRVNNFPNANHSIHNARDPVIVDKFIRAVEEVYTELEYMDALEQIQTELNTTNTTLD